MEPRLNGVMVLSCNGIPVRGSSFPPRSHCNWSVKDVIWIFAASRIWLPPDFGVTRYMIWVTNALKKVVSFFPSQIVISCYGRVTSLPFYRQSLRIEKQPMQYRRIHRNNQLFLVCKQCWIHVRHISNVCEPCGGCEVFSNIGFELDIL